MPDGGQDAEMPDSDAERERRAREALGNSSGGHLLGAAPTAGWDKYRDAAARLEALYGVGIQAEPRAGQMAFAVQEKTQGAAPGDPALLTLLEAMTEASGRTCQVCGDGGARGYRPSTWIMTLCVEHARTYAGFRFRKAPQLERDKDRLPRCLEPSHPLWYVMGCGSLASPTAVLTEHIQTWFDTQPDLRGVCHIGWDGERHSWYRDQPSWAHQEIRKRLLEFLSANTEVEAVEFSWRDGEIFTATREAPFFTQSEQAMEKLQGKFDRGEISREEFFARLGEVGKPVRKPIG